ncbi:MAG: MBL fold metallo-hydrolase [Eubacteriaceae bacterium]|nr:MBL fold metallo-hydrolase [Eubacteriaceae bacterium]
MENKNTKRRLAALLAAVAMAFMLASCELIDLALDILSILGNNDTAISSDINGDGSSDAPLMVCFIDVGQADAIYIECEGEAMLIDGGNSSESSLIYSFLEGRNVRYLKYIVNTHPHEDHIGGLNGALNFAQVGTALCPTVAYSSRSFNNFVESLAKQNKKITLPKAGQVLSLGSASIEILGPIKKADDINNMSIVLRLTYKSASFLFTGDAEREAEAEILKSGANISSTVLKVGHHGSANSSTYPFLREVMPDYAVISVGTDNSYGHPTKSALDRLYDEGASVYRTDSQGDIYCYSDGYGVWFHTSKGKSSSESPSLFIGNSRSKVLHTPQCSSLPSEANRMEFKLRRDAIESGYKPCSVCLP